jgi:hypothetical protein
MFTPTITGEARQLGFSYRAEYNNFRRLYGPVNVNSSKELAISQMNYPQWINHQGKRENPSLDERHQMVKDASA